MKSALPAIALTLTASIASADATDAQLLNCDRITNDDEAKLTCFEALVPAPIDTSGFGRWEVSEGITRTSRKPYIAVTLDGTGQNLYPYDPPRMIINCVDGSQNFYLAYNGDPDGFTGFDYFWDFDGVSRDGMFSRDYRADLMYFTDEARDALTTELADHDTLQIEWRDILSETKYFEFDLRGLAAVLEATAGDCWEAGAFSRSQ